MLLTKGYCIGRDDSTFRVSLSPLYINADQVLQDLNYQVDTSFKADIQIRSYLIEGSDSTLLYDLEFQDQLFKKGIHQLPLNFDQNDKLDHADYSFLEVIERFQLTPPGSYYTVLQVKRPHDGGIFSYSYLLDVDSNLSFASPFRKELDNELINHIHKEGSLSTPANEQVKQAQIGQLERHVAITIAKRKGVQVDHIVKDNLHYSAFYYKQWFLGYYELAPKKPLLEKLIKQRKLFDCNPVAFVKTDIENFSGINAQTKNLQLGSGKNEITGNIDLTTNLSNDQEPGSAQDNNYQDVYANLSTEIFKIPVTIEGYYTTQDINRKAKAGYIRVSYDAERSKEELNKTLSGYKSQYNATRSKATGINGIYQSVINRLVAELRQNSQSLTQEYGISNDLLQAYNGDVDQVVANMDAGTLTDKATSGDSSQLADKKNKLIKNKQKIQEQYQKGLELQRKINKYQKQLDQYQDHQYFDSALAYDRIDKLSKDPNTSYKQLAKAATHLLPPGKASNFINGLTKLEVGILNAYESDYTLSGQTLKGGSVGYDIGFATVGAALGKTEYISRTGNVDQYSSTLLRVDLKPSDKRTIGLVYYIYSPTKQMVQDNRFFKDETGVPSFQSPTHILSVPYSVKATKDLMVEGEAAFSYKAYDRKTTINYDNTALQTNVTYMIPKTGIGLNASWEHLGKRFENNSLPFPKAATEHFQVGSKASLFKSFLIAGVQFNYLQQENFASKGQNIKWGFDLRTNSKQYPNVYVSFKPFSTFRKFDDTLTIQQRPLVGAVWIARTSYRIKSLQGVHRLMLTYNSNNSTMDTISYQNTVLQAAYIYTDRTLMGNLNVGWSKQPYYVDQQQVTMTGYFGAVAVSRNISDKINAGVGQDISFNEKGLQRIATTINGSYRPQKLPIGIRLMLRYAHIKQNVLFSGNKDIWTGQLGCNWLIRPKHKRNLYQ